MPSPPSGGPRASRSVKLVLMGVAGAALLYSCGPGVGAGLGALPYLWFMPNPFYRPPVAGACAPGTPNCEQADDVAQRRWQRQQLQQRSRIDDRHGQGLVE